MNNKSAKKINFLKELIMSKGFTLKDAAAETGVGYHLFQKVVIRTSYIGKGGRTRFYENRHVREKIAAWLGYPYELVWGSGSDFFLKKMIAEELKRQAKNKTNQKLQALGILTSHDILVGKPGPHCTAEWLDLVKKEIETLTDQVFS